MNPTSQPELVLFFDDDHPEARDYADTYGVLDRKRPHGWLRRLLWARVPERRQPRPRVTRRLVGGVFVGAEQEDC